MTSDKKSGIFTFVKVLFGVVLILAEAFIVMLLAHVLHDWSDRIPTIGYGRAVVLVSIISVWMTLRIFAREVASFDTDRRKK